MISRAFNLTAESIAKLGVNLEAARPIDGPIAARMSEARAPSWTIAWTPARAISAITPRHPACNAPAILRFASTNRIGTQSAVKIPSITAGLGSDESVAGRTQPGGIASRGMNDVAMHLVEARDDFQIGHFAAQAFPVGIDGALVVADPIGKIHRGERAGADAAGAPDEAVADRRVGPRADDFDARVRKFVSMKKFSAKITGGISQK